MNALSALTHTDPIAADVERFSRGQLEMGELIALVRLLNMFAGDQAAFDRITNALDRATVNPDARRIAPIPGDPEVSRAFIEALAVAAEYIPSDEGLGLVRGIIAIAHPNLDSDDSFGSVAMQSIIFSKSAANRRGRLMPTADSSRQSATGTSTEPAAEPVAKPTEGFAGAADSSVEEPRETSKAGSPSKAEKPGKSRERDTDAGE